MSTVSARSRLAVALVLGALVAGRAAAQSPEPLAVPAHGMLEDPFNRAVAFDQLERYESGGLRWDADAWLGRAYDRFAIRTEGERADGETEQAELQFLWTHAFSRWWEVVAGARADFEPGSSRNWAAFGVQGLAPYRFDIEATAYVGEHGDTAMRFEGEYDLLITSRLILQPQLELDWYGQADPARRRGSGLSSVEAGLRLRYEIRREVAPYLGLVRERLVGNTADQARAAGRDPEDSSLVAGIRIRF